MAVEHTPAASLDDIPGSIPEGHVPDNADATELASLALGFLNDLRAEHLASNIIWRDILAFTDTFRTFSSIEIVLPTLQKLSHAKSRSVFSLASTEPRVEHSGDAGWLDIDLLFNVEHGGLAGKCAGIVSLTQNSSGEWKIWMLRTWLEYYEGHGNPDAAVWKDSSAVNASNGVKEHVYDAIFVGGGQGGLGAAGRSQALGIDYILFDERPAIGDSWGHRYDSLKWHTVREYGNLPFGRTFSPTEEDLLPKDRIAAGYKNWAQTHGINAQENTQVDAASWDETAEQWTVSTSGAFGRQEWRTKNLVLCIGPGHKKPVSPEWASEEHIKASGFRGTIMHSYNYQNASAWAGKRGIVIGTANTAHDVAEDMADRQMHTTMVQRGATFVFPGEWLAMVQSINYHTGKETGIADRELVTVPNKIQREMLNRGVWFMIKQHPKLFDDLEQAGFKVDRYADLFNNLYSRYGGHYVDIGASSRIINGEIKVDTRPVKGLTQNGVRFEDGGELEADLIVLCTGFNHNFRQDAADIVGIENADRMDDFWGMDNEGELRGFSRLAGHPHLFYHGTEARLSRFFSRFLALQLQRMKLGPPLQPYLEGK